MNKVKVLFVCIHNSARSQMAEAFLNALGGEEYSAESAGLEPGKLNPLAVESMKEVGLDISGKETKSVFNLYKEGKMYRYVTTVCDQANAERCPTFPAAIKRLHWSFEDPSALQGSHEERLKKTGAIRDAVKAKIEEWVKEMGNERR